MLAPALTLVKLIPPNTNPGVLRLGGGPIAELARLIQAPAIQRTTCDESTVMAGILRCIAGLESVWPARRWDHHQPQYTRIGIRRDQLHERERRGRAYVRPRDDRDRLLLGPQLGRQLGQPFAQTDARARARVRAIEGPAFRGGPVKHDATRVVGDHGSGYPSPHRGSGGKSRRIAWPPFAPRSAAPRSRRSRSARISPCSQGRAATSWCCTAPTG